MDYYSWEDPQTQSANKHEEEGIKNDFVNNFKNLNREKEIQANCLHFQSPTLLYASQHY